jgi:regulator of cell morphogenesis and NO signaling
MAMNSATTVRELVIQMPEATRVFEKFKIDYCCGGNTSLVEACARAGVDLREVKQELEHAGRAKEIQATDFSEMILPVLIDHIVTRHHLFTREEMVRLDALLTKVVSVHGDKHPELHEVSTLLKRLGEDLNPHMLKEERVLFPYIVQLDRSVNGNASAPFAPFGTVKNPVRMMMMEHDAAGDILRELRRVTSDYAIPSDACISYKTLYEALEALERDLHQHIHLENNILFPKAVEFEESLLRAIQES